MSTRSTRRPAKAGSRGSHVSALPPAPCSSTSGLAEDDEGFSKATSSPSASVTRVQASVGFIGFSSRVGLEQGESVGGRPGTKATVDCAAGSAKRLRLAVKLERPVRLLDEGVDLERELPGFGVWVEMPGVRRGLGFPFQQLHPAPGQLDHAIPDAPGPVVHFRGDSREEAAAPEQPLFHVAEPGLGEVVEPAYAGVRGELLAEDFPRENLPGRLDDRELELFLGPEVSEELQLAVIEAAREVFA